MSATTRFHEAANDALVQISNNLWPEAKLALVIYTPGEPGKDIVLKDQGLVLDEVISTLRRSGLSIDGDNAYKQDLFKVNTGCREQEVCKLRWDWEISVPELGTSVFLIPADFGGRHANSGVKNRDERLVVLNSVAKSIIDKQRGVSREWVFPYKDTAVHRMNDTAWKKARVRAAKLWQEKNLRPAHPGYASIRIHDLKHTFGRRLKAAGVTEEDRKALLGHKNGSITSHYSGAELGQLIEAANMVSATDSRGPVLTILKRRSG